MWVDHSVSCRHVHQAIRVVSLRDSIQLKLPGLGLIVRILDPILLVAIEDALTPLHRVDTVRVGDFPRVRPRTLQLLFLHRADSIPVAVSLTVDISERRTVQRRAHQGVLVPVAL